MNDPTWSADAPDAVGASDGPSAEGAPSTKPVPRVRMGDFYVSSKSVGPSVGSQAMSTRELQNKLKELGKWTLGPRNVLMERYQMYTQEEYQSEMGSGEVAGSHASDKPMMVMVDETIGNKYMRSVKHKGLGDDGDNSWLITYMHQ